MQDVSVLPLRKQQGDEKLLAWGLTIGCSCLQNDPGFRKEKNAKPKYLQERTIRVQIRNECYISHSLIRGMW